MAVSGIDLGKYKLGWADSTDDYAYIPKKGLNEEIVREISGQKSEPDWMRDFRLKSLKRFERKPMLEWFAKNMPTIDFDDIYYYLKPTDKGEVADSWDMLPESMKATYEKLGIPEAERKYLAGVTAQFESETVYHKNRDELAKQGVLFTDMDTAVREYPEIVREHFATVIPPGDNKFAALNSTVWSGGSFIYVPPGVHVEMPGPKAHGEVLSVAYAGEGMHQDAGAKMTHVAPDTTSIIESKSISKDGGRTTYRGLVKVDEGAHNVKSHVRCDALILDEDSRSDTYPYMEIEEKDARIGHEATVSKVGEDQIFYLMSRGLSEQQATAMIVNGFIEPIVKTLPVEYAVELSRLIELNMEGAVG